MSHIELDLEERRQFYQLLERKLPMTAIAQAMRRHNSTLYREFKRNFWHDENVSNAGRYWSLTAQRSAKYPGHVNAS